jgi:lipid A 3-O-deacylase
LAFNRHDRTATATAHPRAAVVAALVAGAAIGAAAPVAAPAKELVSPAGVFVEGGKADDGYSAVVGTAITWLQPSKWGAGNASGYLELSVGEWMCRKHADGDLRACSTQIGITPVIRYAPSWWEHWYGEIGIGADAIFPRYQSESRHFGSEYNFGDHLGIGRKFGDDGADEVELRAEHYSNGGYKHPNPGENWVQIRYMHWF